MKKFFFLLVAMMVSTVSFAQFVQTRNSASGSSSSNREISNDWSTFYASYNYFGFSEGEDNMDGVTLGYNRAIHIVPNLPLYLEVGGAVRYTAATIDYYYGDSDFKAVSINAPVSVLYHFGFPNSTIGIEPYAGLDFSYAVYGDLDGENYYTDGPGNAFQMGWHIGANVVFNKFFLGISYGTNFTDFAEESGIKLNTLSANIGFRF